MKPSGGGGGGGGYYLHRRAPEAPFHLLELTVISAQDLQRWSRRVRAYAAAWVRPDERLRTQVDRSGHTNPTWNDKFVFRVDGAFLRSDTAAVTVAIHASRSRLSPRPDPVLGVVRVLLSSLLPRPSRPAARRVAALQVRRPASLRPQGILNVAVALLDPCILSMPLCRAPPRAFALKDLPMAAPRSGKRIDEEEEEEDDDEGLEQGGREKGALMVDRSGPLEESRSAEMRERRELESKIEKWKTELSPEHDAKERKIRRSSCFCGGPDWER